MPFSLRSMYDWAVQECSRTDLEYNQSYRNQQVNPNTGKICYDCSSFTFFACWLGGGLDVGAFGYSTNISDYHTGIANAWTVTPMVTVLESLPGWQRLDPRVVQWQEGDILALTATHCEICYRPPTRTMGAHNPARGVSINDFETGYNYYDILLRYTGSGPTPGGRMPIWLIKRAIENQKGGFIF